MVLVVCGVADRHRRQLCRLHAIAKRSTRVSRFYGRRLLHAARILVVHQNFRSDDD